MPPALNPASNVLAIVDGTDEYRAAALAGADLFSSTPGLKFTVLAPAEVAQPSGSPASNGSGLIQLDQATGVLMRTVREIEDRGLKVRMRTIEGSLLAKAAEVAEAHDLVVLPASMADLADQFPVPVMLAP